MFNKLFVVICVAMLSLSVFATDANEVVRRPKDLAKCLNATEKQAVALKAVDTKFEALLNKLRKDAPKDYTISRDTLNEQYTKQFLSKLSPIQKSNYRKFIRSLRENYIKTHPEVDADSIIIWGGANLL